MSGRRSDNVLVMHALLGHLPRVSDLDQRIRVLKSARPRR